ncbi:MAG: 16S rRNA (adenine(1518)-N(6)/adenine(1519)-N(6))-dimethyltransferase RsmA [Bacteroidota bacterium]|nr:16S rRNA (adenine(1518)-N(6)/adenine(1519)-N(6))-dimethyltransferase RsmA [Bacteroidota bacterium]MDP4217652.1 16S rRNA (adenine(1518)-N(6)/adenine(1519)-N(6))-dimethyltransferase RsmA [Bacteroidota bacterium]MDP4246680.1 16S rRNA (adenine(1518)-N(6)/adenine(1519)-N(6))-dimethyltransferase RsmA [Bacteroidota bacterium]MDP4256382.1 16S rRNA (adenine(1518)-N(6)/adenine(1519)-N(6))-dimethyltransferase RsmA [Bacteroidota bacterium]MDP4260028.1 16S rRNA (adenine(1518)-N(6)/adenine(1519)-N(6))-dim
MYTLRKSLGQHFLRDENIARKIVTTIQEYPFSRLLEVGPGAGALTKYLLELSEVDLRAVELDEEKVRYLHKTWPVLEGRIIQGSILEMEKPFVERFTVVGNFPYNISSQILFKMLDWRSSLETMTGMFQKEVAQRVVAPEGSKTYGVLSVLIQAFFNVEYLFEVHEQSFNPPPKVKSAVIRLRPREMPLAMKGEKAFFQLVKTAFNQRRKTLRNAIKALFDPADLAQPIFDRRAEQLSVNDFVELTWKMR